MQNIHLNFLRLLRCVLLALPLGLVFAAPASAMSDAVNTDQGTVTALAYNDEGQVESFTFKRSNNTTFEVNVTNPSDRHTENLQRFKDGKTTIKLITCVNTEGEIDLVKYSE